MGNERNGPCVSDMEQVVNDDEMSRARACARLDCSCHRDRR